VTDLPAFPIDLDEYILVRRDRAVTYPTFCRLLVYGLCLGGMAMGIAVARAHSLKNADFTYLSSLPGWPEVWGIILAVLGALSLLSRLIGDLTKHRIGNALASVAMVGMSCWYCIFAASLVLGTAQYGQYPYLTLAAMHGGFSVLVWRTNGFRPSTPGAA
jgi:hypothetical protein